MLTYLPKYDIIYHRDHKKKEKRKTEEVKGGIIMCTQNIEFIKHFRHMTRNEILYLTVRKKKLLRKHLNFSDHAKERMEERHIKEKDIVEGLKNGQIIEYKKTDTEEILVVRSCYVNRRKKQCYIVYSLTKNLVITTYSNYYYQAYHSKDENEKYSPDEKISIPEYYLNIVKAY